MDLLAQIDIGDEFGSPFGRTAGLGYLTGTLVSNAVAIAAVILLFLLVLGGIGIISGAGEQNPDKMAKGKQAITAAIIGFVLVFGAYWIIQIIERITGVNILNPGF